MFYAYLPWDSGQPFEILVEILLRLEVAVHRPLGALRETLQKVDRVQGAIAGIEATFSVLIRKGKVLFNDALNTFYLGLYGVG